MPGGGQPSKDVYARKRGQLRRKHRARSFLLDGHVSRAIVLARRLENWSEAEKEHRLALKLAPILGALIILTESIYSGWGRFARGHSPDKLRGRELGSTESVGTVDHLASVALASRQPDLAIEEFKNAGDDLGLGFAYGQKKMYLDAAAAFQRVCKPKGAGAVCSVEFLLGLMVSPGGRTRQSS